MVAQKIPFHLLAAVALAVAFFAPQADAQSRQKLPVIVTDTDFEDYDLGAPDDWIRYGIELRAQENPTDEDADWVNNIKVTFSIAYEDSENAGTFHWYQSEVEILTLEIAKERSIYFYLPWDIVERDNLPDDPYGWTIELSVDGRRLPLQTENFSRTIGSQEVLTSFQNGVQQNAEKNAGALRPQYFVPMQRDHLESPTLKRYDNLP